MHAPDATKVHLFFTQHAATDAFRRALGTTRAGRLIDLPTLPATLSARRGSAPADLLVGCDATVDAQRAVVDFACARERSDSDAALVSVVTVLDAATTRDTLLGATGRGTTDPESPVALATQIEHAATLVLTGWHALDPADLHPLTALLGHLNPTATLVLLGPRASLELPAHPTDLTVTTLNRPGWIHLLSDAFTPRLADPRVRAVHYRNLRPFHPERLARLLDAGLCRDGGGTPVRSAGFCRLASRPHATLLWDHCGTELGLGRLPTDEHTPEPLSFGQDLAVVGLDLDVPRLTAALDACVLDDDEFLLGPDRWAALPDPLPGR